MVVDLTEVEDAPAGEAGRESETASLASLREALARKRKERREAERKVAALREEEQDLELLIEGIEDQEESARRARNRPDWAGAFIDQRTSKPVWLAHDDGRLAGLLPISTMPLCLMCHGEKNSLMEPIRTALHENYPDDQATGFAPGDLRGWFWLEIPKP